MFFFFFLKREVNTGAETIYNNRDEYFIIMLLQLVMFVTGMEWRCFMYDGIETIVFIGGIVNGAYRAIWFD